jgi:hypothetical protein
MNDRKSSFPKFWSDDSPITMRMVLLLVLVGGAGFSVGGGYFALKNHEKLPGHPVIVEEFQAEREKNREAMAKLTRSIDKLNITLKLQGDGTWQRVQEATGAANAGP